MRLDPETGELVEDGGCASCETTTRAMLEAEAKLQGVERELTNQIRRNGQLRSELEKQRLDTPEGRVAKAIGRYWLTRCGKGARTKVKDKRLKAVIERLKEGYEPSFIARAIDGAAAGAHTDRPETQRLALVRVMEEAIRRVDEDTAAELRTIYKDSMGRPKVYDDLELICRDEVKLEDFHDRAERTNAPTLVGPAWINEIEGVKMDTAKRDTPF